MHLPIIRHKNIWLIFSGTLTLVSLLIWIAFGLKTGIDFTGGSLMEVEYMNSERPAQSAVLESLKDLDLSFTVSAAGSDGYILRFQTVTEEKHQEILKRLDREISTEPITDSEEGVPEPELREVRFDSIGPVIGKELTRKSIYALIAVLIAIILYIAYSFRKVSYPVSSWKYGIVAVMALFHDITITVGAFVLFGKFLGLEVNVPFIAALLTILGYSVNDTIVIFDRIRENLHKVEGTFEEIVEKAVNDTLARSINTTLTTLLTLIAVYFFGGATIKDFVLALIIGIFLGAYSSIFVASPILVAWQQISWKLKRGK